jgi:hypothetical protein
VKSGLSKAALARALKKSPSTLYSWITGEASPDIASLMTVPRLWKPFLRCLVVGERKAGWI